MLGVPGNQRLPISFRPSMEVLWFAVCVAMATGVLFGLAPALIGAKARQRMPYATGRGRRRAGLHCSNAGWWWCRRRCRLYCWWARGFFRKAWQAAAYGHEAGVEEPLYRPFLRTDGGL